jgi:cell division protein FtsA
MYKLALPPGDTIIEVLAQEYIVDGEPGVIDPIGMPGSRIEGIFHVITGSSIAISNIKRCIEEAGLKVKDVIMQPLASAAAVLTEEEKQAGVALVDIGGGTTDVAIFIEGVIGHTAVIPFGGEIVTEDIKKGCNIMKSTAERLKTLHGSAIAEKSSMNEVIAISGIESRQPKEISMMNLAHIIQARMEDILGFVSNEISVSGLQNRLLGGLVLTGGGSKLKHIRQLTEYMTGLETRIGHPDQNLAPTEVKDVNNQIYATGIGLIIKGMERMKYEQQIAEKVDNIVEKPTNVENKLPQQEPNGVALDVKPIENDAKVKEASENEVDNPEMRQKQNKNSIIIRLSRIRDKIIDFMGEDLADFSDTKKDSQTKK